MSNRILWRLGLTWRLIFAILLPLVLLPLVFIEDDDMIEDESGNKIKSTVQFLIKFKAAYTILIVGLYWMFEVMPLAVTSLIPLILFPFLGVLSTDSTAKAYFKETSVMLLGGFVIELAVEYCNLHKRVAFKAMAVTGTSPIRLLIGVMSTSMFLSMWMSNTACCAMMLPIILAVLDQLSAGPVSDFSKEHSDRRANVSNLSTDETGKMSDSVDDNEKARWESIRKMYLFGTAYASSLGGTATITGTGPNLVFQSMIKRVDVSQGGKYLGMNFANWMALNVPASLLNVVITFIYLVVRFHGFPGIRQWPLISRFFKTKKTKDQIDKEAEEERRVKLADNMLKEEYKKLGKMNFHESAVATIFCCIILLWFFREPQFMKGWNEWFKDAQIGDGTISILAVVIFFLVPRDFTFFTGVPRKGEPYKALLDWKFVQDHLPWGVLLLLGCGSAISDGADISGLSQFIGDQLQVLENLPRPVMLLIVMVLVAAITEVCSNVTTANVVLPILISLSQTIGIHPFYLTIPATVACSFAFMFPAATPPNAIMFSAGNLRIIEMVSTGVFLNITCIVVYFLVHISYGELLFDYSNYEWPRS